MNSFHRKPTGANDFGKEVYVICACAFVVFTFAGGWCTMGDPEISQHKTVCSPRREGTRRMAKNIWAPTKIGVCIRQLLDNVLIDRTDCTETQNHGVQVKPQSLQSCAHRRYVQPAINYGSVYFYVSLLQLFARECGLLQIADIS